MEIQAGKTSKIIAVKLLDTASSTADGKTGLLHTDVTASYFREGQAAVSIALAAGSPGDAFSAGKFAEVSSTLARGHYFLHVPDAALAAGSESVTIHLQAAGVFDKKIEISLVAYDPQNSNSLGVALIETIEDIEVTVGDTKLESASIKSVTDKLDSALEDDLSSGWQFTTLALENGPSGSGGGGDATAANQVAMQASLNTIAGYIDTEVAAIKVVTDNIFSTIEQACDAALIAYDTATNPDLVSIKAVTDKLDSALEDDGASGWQFTTLALENGPSGGGGDATAANQAAMQASLNTIAGYIDTEVAAIKTNTEDILADLEDKPTSQEFLVDLKADSTFVSLFAVSDKLDTALEDDLSSGWQFTTLALENGPAGAGGGGDATAANQAAMQASLNTIAGYIDTEVAAILGAVDTEVAAILSELAAIKGSGFTSANSLENIAAALNDLPTTDDLPPNFDQLSIDGSGRVLSLLQGILSTVFSAETTGGRLAGNLQTFLDNADAATTKTLDDIGTASLSGDFTTQIQNALVAAGAALKSDLPDGFNTLVIVGGSARATIEGGLPIPLESDAPIESQAYGIRDADFEANFALATTAGTKLVFTLRENPRSDEADLEIDSDVGLEIGPHSTVTATDAVVERVDAGTVRVWIKASTFNGLTRKSYAFDLREINTTANPSTTEVKTSGCLTIQRTAGREIAA